MKKTVLLYNFNKARLPLVRKALAPLGCTVKTVVKKDYSQPIGYLAGAEGILPCKEKHLGSGFDEEMLVMYGFGSELIDVLIAALKNIGVGKIDLKAVITPNNINWDSVTLYNEIKKEHTLMNK